MSVSRVNIHYHRLAWRQGDPWLMHSQNSCTVRCSAGLAPPKKDMTKAGVGSRNEVAPTMCNAPPSARTASVSWPQFWDPQNHSFGVGLLGGRLLRTRIVKHVNEACRPARHHVLYRGCPAGSAARPGSAYAYWQAQQRLRVGPRNRQAEKGKKKKRKSDSKRNTAAKCK